MFKGIHNEAEFYTNFYFDNKLSSDLQSKVATFSDIKDKTDKLKGLESFYWIYRDTKPSNESLLEFYQKLLTVLGYQFDLKVVDTLKETSFNSVVQVHAEERTNLYVFLTNEIEEGTFETAPLTFNITENPETRELSEVTSEFFDELENPPKWILVGSPTTMFLLERNKWAFGKYIKFNWDEIFQQKTDDLFSSILGLISKDSLCPSTGQSIHAEMDDNSHRHAFEVTTELRESVRESIELLINEMIYQKKDKHQAYMSKVDSSLYAKELSHDALFYAYRLIFLLFLEAQAEDSELLPLKSEIYRHGYSLEKLLELVHDIPDENTADFDGTFAFDSLQQIFSLIFFGFDYKVERDLLTDTTITNSGFLLKGIKSDLFSPDTVKHLKDIKLRNGVMLIVLRKLSLSSTGKGKNKRLTRVSYSNLGINQLGAVYEGLLSYSGFFAQEDLHALKPASTKQSDIDNGRELDKIYLAPKSIVEKYSNSKEKKYKITTENLVIGDDGNPKIYKKGAFIYRLAGRDRQRLASYYTPESLTKCSVKYSLKVISENKKSLNDLWALKILEPAMGSGAFLNEAVNQIADKILELEVLEKVRELKTPKDKQKRLWEIKYELISKNVYGVDLNPTAIELARFSLWLNCIGAGKEPPQFDGRLKIGNSLVGARFKKGVDGTYPWLLLDDGMMSYGKRLKDYDSEGFEKIQNFRKEFLSSKIGPTDPIVQTLQSKAESILKELTDGETIEIKTNAYNRLKLCGDIWCSLFFVNASDLKHYPKKHRDLIGIYINILENEIIDSEFKMLVQQKFFNERFFHWEIEFPEIISSGGFSLILGNPPWISLSWDEAFVLSDSNPLPTVKELSGVETSKFIDEEITPQGVRYLFENGISYFGYNSLLSVDFYKLMSGGQKNTYKAFDVLSLFLLKSDGVAGLIHEDGVYKDARSGELRKSLYRGLIYHFEFLNEKLLFAEVDHKKRYSINIFTTAEKNQISFTHLSNLFSTRTIDDCFNSIGEGDLPLIKDEFGKWDVRGHSDRIIQINLEALKIFSKFLGMDDPFEAPLLGLHSKQLLSVISKICLNSILGSDFLAEEANLFSEMIHETGGQKEKLISEVVSRPKSKFELVLSGPHIFTANPVYQEVREKYEGNSSYDRAPLEILASDFIQRSRYKLTCSSSKLDETLPSKDGKSYRSFYRVLSRRRLDLSAERCIFTCIIPPGVSHIHPLSSMTIPMTKKGTLYAGVLSSLISEAAVRLRGMSDLNPSGLIRFQVPRNESFYDSIVRRTIMLNCVDVSYSPLWNSVVKELSQKADTVCSFVRKFDDNWSSHSFLKTDNERRLALLELDVLVGMSFGLSFDEIKSLYLNLFPVLAMYDRQEKFDRTGEMSRAFNLFEQRGW